MIEASRPLFITFPKRRIKQKLEGFENLNTQPVILLLRLFKSFYLPSLSNYIFQDLWTLFCPGKQLFHYPDWHIVRISFIRLSYISTWWPAEKSCTFQQCKQYVFQHQLLLSKILPRFKFFCIVSVKQFSS